MAKKKFTNEELSRMLQEALEENEALRGKMAGLQQEKDPTQLIKDLRKQVLRERIQGIDAQIELGQALKKLAEAELASL
jgi:hypothetical protein